MLSLIFVGVPLIGLSEVPDSDERRGPRGEPLRRIDFTSYFRDVQS
jgi:hypothetical protein